MSARRAPACHADPGLQPERTVMSWGRSVLAFGVVALTFLRWFPEVGAWALVPAVLAAAVGSVVMLGQRQRYARGSAGIVDERVRPATASVAGLCAAVMVLALLGLAATLTAGR
ncbi:DUF202 domain-containing protein [Micrococcaceae bacterium Sec6.3]